eukprot:SAG31_NODE_12988_length_901_cov_1.266833_1_plen_117_part_00
MARCNALIEKVSPCIKCAHSAAVWDPTPVFDEMTGETFILFGGPGRTAQDSRLDITMVSSTDLVRLQLVHLWCTAVAVHINMWHLGLPWSSDVQIKRCIMSQKLGCRASLGPPPGI